MDRFGGRAWLLPGILCILALTGCVRLSLEKPDREAAQRLLEARCKRCHPLTRVYAKDYDRTEWSRIIEEMFSRGGTVTERERDIMSLYLSHRR